MIRQGLNSFSLSDVIDLPLPRARNPEEDYETVKGIRDNYQTAMPIVEQNVDAVFSIADRLYLMALGKVVAEDVPAKLTRERLKELFLG